MNFQKLLRSFIDLGTSKAQRAILAKNIENYVGLLVKRVETLTEDLFVVKYSATITRGLFTEIVKGELLVDSTRPVEHQIEDRLVIKYKIDELQVQISDITFTNNGKLAPTEHLSV